MPLRHLLRYLLNNEQLIQKIADSYPVRRAAQLTAFFIHKGKEIGEDKLEKLKESDIVNRLQNEAKHSADSMQEKANRSVQKADNFMSTFMKNLNEEWKKAEEKLRLEQEKKNKK